MEVNTKQSAEINRLCGLCHDSKDLTDRMERISNALLGYPYITGPLNKFDETEQLIVNLEAFDCVTFVETVLALALCKAPADFQATLKALRYAAEEISWLERNHYATNWVRNNEGKGYLRNITPSHPVCSITREFSALANFPTQTQSISFLPPEGLPTFSASLQTGDLIFFGTMRENLDFSHEGILIREASELKLRHASRSKACVCEETLSAFLARFGASPGVVVARPTRPIHDLQPS
jgi:cell wall-associated NlpC family hydrolase